MLASKTLQQFEFVEVIDRICGLQWEPLTESEIIDVAWAYYFFSVQFRENLQIARRKYPDDLRLERLEIEECDTDNLSPWPGVASPGERLDHDEFMKRLLELTPIADEKRQRFEIEGARYLATVRSFDPTARALSISSYEDGGLERVFNAILKAPFSDNPLLMAFRHFLSEHIRFDSDPLQGHGALSRHLMPNDRIVPLWKEFELLLIGFVPQLSH